MFMKLDKNRAAVLGGGHGAHTMAAEFTAHGFKVHMYEMPEFKHNVKQLFDTKTIEVKGVFNGQYLLEKVTSDIEEAIDGAKYINIVVPAFAHKAYAELLKGKVNKEQLIILYPGSFGGLLFKKIFGEDECPIIAETNTLPYDTRLIGPCKVMLYGRNPVNIAFMPGEKGNELFEETRKLFPFVTKYNDLLEAGLSSVNPNVHSGLCLFSINDIDNWPKRPFFLYEHAVTPPSIKMNMALEDERRKIGKKFGMILQFTKTCSG
jgi:opine dehydrogenase